MSTELITPTHAPLASQATAVEQARAVAEVQAAVTVAQSIPRDPKRAEAEMLDTCSRLSLANRAFYSMPRAGGRVEGSTVQLARELARIWGNVDYGVRELRRDDTAGESEMQAFAWDQQTNVRSTRSFIVPHARMANKQRRQLTDLGDIYLNNQNIGARAVRECIFTILPVWFTDAAEQTARRTLKHGEGKPLSQRIQDMLDAFAKLNVTAPMLEAKFERRQSSWNENDIANATVIFQTISNGEAMVDDMFPQAPAHLDAPPAELEYPADPA